MQFLEGRLHPLLSRFASHSSFTAICALLAFAGTLTAAYPVTAVVVPATLLIPARWKSISLACAFGSALAATVLVLIFHHMGWTQIYEHFPALQSQPAWQDVTEWGARYGVWALFFIALSPLPQTPALMLLGSSEQAYFAIFFAMLGGKTLKYGLFAWLARHFPERLSGKLRNVWQDWRRSVPKDLK